MEVSFLQSMAGLPFLRFLVGVSSFGGVMLAFFSSFTASLGELCLASSPPWEEWRLLSSQQLWEESVLSSFALRLP